jgi:lipopolysaccharide export LptBFGC system permease protein LptF
VRRSDRYLFSSLVGSTLSGVVLALVLLVSLQVIRLGGLIIKTGGDLSIMSKFFGGLSLSFTPIIFPIAFIFSSLTVFGRMSSDRELIALQGLGYSPWQIMRPCFKAASILSLITLICALYIGPLGNRLFEMSIDEALSKKGASALKAGTFTEDFLDYVIYIGESKGDNRFKKIFIYESNPNFNLGWVMSAKEAKWNPANSSGWASMQLFDGTLVSKNLEENLIWRISFDESKLNADFRYAEGKSRDSMESQDLKGLLKKRGQPPKEISKIRLIWIEIARRFLISLSIFFFVPLCFILCLRNQRTAQSRTILTGVLMAMFYWGSYSTLVSWASRSPATWLHQEILMWIIVGIPNVMVGALALIFIKKKFGKILEGSHQKKVLIK